MLVNYFPKKYLKTNSEMPPHGAKPQVLYPDCTPIYCIKLFYAMQPLIISIALYYNCRLSGRS